MVVKSIQLSHQVKGNNILVIFLVYLFGCVDPLIIPIKKEAPQLVVNGRVTNESDVQTVRLNFTKTTDPYVPGNAAPVRGARVTVADKANIVYPFAEVSPGLYTANFKGVVGNMYTLRIITQDGKEYVSSAETMQAGSFIDKIYFEIERNTSLSRGGSDPYTYHDYTANVYIDTPDPAEEKNYYQWQYLGTHVSYTQWEASCCNVCWITVPNDVISIADDRLVNGKEIKRQLITKIPISGKTFSARYHVDVKQYSISEAAYDYWAGIKTQVYGVGNLQDPPPATILGNIRNVKDANDVALGYFSASAVSRKTMFITTKELSVPIPFFDYPYDCRTLERSTAKKPDFWP